MSQFHLTIVTPDGAFFDGQAESITLRTVTGEMTVLKGHADLVTALGMGQAKVVVEGQTRVGACIGGMLSVARGDVTVMATTFEWAEDIDKARAEASARRARTVLDNKGSHSGEEIALAEARLKRALVRTGTAR